MRRLALLTVLAATVACERAETHARSSDTAGASAVVAPDTRPDARPVSLSDTLPPLAPAPRAPAQLAVDATVKPVTLVGSDQPVTSLCPAGLEDTASGVTLVLVRSMQSVSRPLGRADSTVRGRADYRPSDPARFGLATDQVLRVDCGTRRVLGLAPDITTAPAPAAARPPARP